MGDETTRRLDSKTDMLAAIATDTVPNDKLGVLCG